MESRERFTPGNFDFDNDEIDLTKLTKQLTQIGIQSDDPRLHTIYRKITQTPEKYRAKLQISQQEFHQISGINVEFIKRCTSCQLVIAAFPEFCEDLKAVFESCRSTTAGVLPTYIPQLSSYDPNCWGMSVCTIDGQRTSSGDSTHLVTVQSAIHPLTYAIALSEYGTEMVHNHVGTEPSGLFFNEIKLNQENKPHNPFLNAGAIMTIAMIKPELNITDRFNWIVERFKAAAGGKHVSMNMSVFLSERENADRNFALAFLMRENHVYPTGAAREKFQESLELYFMICSLEITVEIGSIMASTLANGGVCPLTGERVFKAAIVKHVLSLMLSCGLNDRSGYFAFRCGLPAKSGISGTLLIVIPNVCGICTWSPPVDVHGNSCRGVDFCNKLVEQFNFHTFDSIQNQTGARKKNPTNTQDSRKHARHQFNDVMYAAKSGDLAAIKEYHGNKFNLLYTDYNGSTLMHTAVINGNTDIVEYLMTVCNELQAVTDDCGKTGLDYARDANLQNIIAILTSEVILPRTELPVSSTNLVSESNDEKGATITVNRV